MFLGESKHVVTPLRFARSTTPSLMLLSQQPRCLQSRPMLTTGHASLIILILIPSVMYFKNFPFTGNLTNMNFQNIYVLLLFAIILGSFSASLHFPTLLLPFYHVVFLPSFPFRVANRCHDYRCRIQLQHLSLHSGSRSSGPAYVVLATGLGTPAP
jgi:hypothetical protein